jgi:RNA polymerase sigma-70 factor, ECF subfamily
MPDNHPDTVAAEFVRLLAAHERRLGSFVATLVPNWNDAEDIVQQTKVRLWEQFGAYDRQRDFGTWACVIARYEVLAFRTRTVRSRVHFSQEFVDRVSGEMAKRAPESDSRLAFLEDCLKKLTQWQRDLLWRCCVAGDSTQRVATELGRKVEATRKAVLRIRRRLYRCIEVAERKEAEDS